MNEKIKTFLQKETGRMVEDEHLNLIETGILDSFSMFKLISFLEAEFGIRVDMEKLSSQDMNSVAAITYFVQKQKKS